MDAEISIHDNFILSYTVDCRQHRITLHTAYEDVEPNEYTNVVFSGVAAYYFECDNFENILFDITEIHIREIYTHDEALFRRLKNYGWPLLSLVEVKGRLDYDSADALIQKLEAQNIRGFHIGSSFGMRGWVLAQEMRVFAAS